MNSLAVANGRSTTVARTELTVNALTRSNPSAILVDKSRLTLSEQLRFERYRGLPYAALNHTDWSFGSDILESSKCVGSSSEIHVRAHTVRSLSSRHGQKIGARWAQKHGNYINGRAFEHCMNKPVDQVGWLCRFGDTRCYASRAGPSVPARTRLIPPIPVSRLPLKQSNDPVVRAKPTTLVHRKTTPLSKHPTRASSHDKGMLVSPSQDERHRERLAFKSDLRRKELTASVDQAGTKINDFCRDVQKTQREDIDRTITLVRRVAKAEYSLEHIQNDLTTWTVSSLSIVRRCRRALVHAIVANEAQYFEVYDRVITKPLNMQLNSIEIECEKCRKVLEEIQMKRRSHAAKVVRDAREIIDNVLRVKEGDGPNLQLKTKLNAVTDTIFEIVKHIHRMVAEEQEVKEKNHQDERIFNTLVKMHDTVQHLAYCISDAHQEHKTKWRFPLAQIAHRAREIELTRQLIGNKNQNNLTFAERWAKSEVAKFTWSWSDTNIELVAEVGQSVFNRHPEVDVHEKNSARIHWLNRFSRLPVLIQTHARRVDKIILIFSRAIGEGSGLLCPHPDKALHHELTHFSRKLEKYDNAWLASIHACQVADVSMQRVLDNANDVDDIALKSVRYREKLISATKSMQHPPTDYRDPLSRRGFLNSRREVLLWHGVNFLHSRRGSYRKSLQDDLKPQNADSRAEQSRVPTAAPNQAERRLPRNWLTDRSLYPGTAPVNVDLVSSHEYLSQTVDVLQSQSILGLDVLTTAKTSSFAPTLDYILMATETNVYVLDVTLLKGAGSQYFLSSMEKILESKTILKVGMNYMHLSTILWEGASVDLTSFYELAQHNDPETPADFEGLLRLIEKTFQVPIGFKTGHLKDLKRVREEFPKTFFYYMGFRAYAPLRLFHALHDQDVIETRDAYSFDAAWSRQTQWERRGLKPCLGPINIDRNYSGLNTSSRYTSLTSYSGPRASWLRKMSHTMGRQLLKGVALSDLPKLSKHRIRGKLSEHAAETAVAAYYLATVFGETLQTIEQYLGLRSAARWILWASDIERLYLHPQDLLRYKSEAQSPMLSADESEGVRSKTDLPPMTQSKLRRSQQRKATTTMKQAKQIKSVIVKSPAGPHSNAPSNIVVASEVEQNRSQQLQQVKVTSASKSAKHENIPRKHSVKSSRAMRGAKSGTSILQAQKTKNVRSSRFRVSRVSGLPQPSPAKTKPRTP